MNENMFASCKTLWELSEEYLFHIVKSNGNEKKIKKIQEER